MFVRKRYQNLRKNGKILDILYNYMYTKQTIALQCILPDAKMLLFIIHSKFKLEMLKIKLFFSCKHQKKIIY